MKPNLYNQRLGKLGEQIASDYLVVHGYTLLERNFKARYGEIDIVCSQDQLLVFVEVKTRIGRFFGLPEEAVTPRKLREVIVTSQYYKLLHPELPDATRIDVIGIELASDESIRYFNHIKNVSQ